MSLSSPYYDDWWLGGEQDRTIRRIVELVPGDPTSRIYEKRRMWVIKRKRYEYNVTGFITQQGDETSSFSNLVTGPTTSFSYTATGKKFICDGDDRELTDPTTGQYERSQVWVHYGPWEEYDIEDYGEEVVEPDPEEPDPEE